MIAFVSVVATGVLATQLTWLSARRFGRPALRLASYDGRTIAFGAIGSLLLAVHAAAFVASLPAVVAIAAAAVSTATDERSGLIFDVVTVPAAFAAGIAAAAAGRGIEALAGGFAVGGILWLLHASTRGRGLGLGDVKLASVVGAAFGVVGGLVAIGIAFVVGASCALALLAARRIDRGAEVRFAPYILCGVLLACDGAA